MKKNEEKKQRPAPIVEPWWHDLKSLYFDFHKKNFKDQDGYPLSPDWNPQKIGMEASALKKIIIFLREIAEGKKIEWSLNYSRQQLLSFLDKSISDPWLRKHFYCAMLNKKKIDTLCKTYNPSLIKKILEIWYYEFPQYTVDRDKDTSAAEIIIGFLKQQYILASLDFSEESVLASVKLIFKTVREDDFWKQKSLKSIANNLQEFVNRIKSKKNGTGKSKGYGSVGKTIQFDRP